jgi:P4 family phage/plasmid primase-like protien
LTSNTSSKENTDYILHKEQEDFRERLIETVNYWYYDKKVNVIPVNWWNKKPNGIDWLPFKINRIPQQLFEEWKNKRLFDNGFGILLGRMYDSNTEPLYLIGIDCDKGEAIQEFSMIDRELRSLEQLSSKFMIERHEDDPNSLHIYFFSKIPFPTKGSDTKLGLEVKGSAEGSGYMIGSPTPHPSGNRWQILGTKEPPTLTKVQAIEMLQHINTICKNYGLEYLEKKSGMLNPELKAMIKNLEIRKSINFIINEGERHSTLVFIANSILFTHLQKDESNASNLKGFFEEINEFFCKPNSLRSDEIDSIWNSALDYVKKNKDFSYSKHRQYSNRKGTNEEMMRIETENLIAVTTERILETHHFLTFEETKEIYYYKSGVYMPGGEVIIEKTAEKLCGYDISNKHITEIKGHIARKTYHKREELDADINIINLENGLYDFQRNKLMPHSPNYLSINQKPITYDPKANHKLFGKFLVDVLYNSEIRTAIETMAYSFYRDCPYEHFFTLFGYGSNGKSVYTGILSALHGERNISNVSLKSIIDNRFALSDLEFKDVNIDAELSNGTIQDTSNLKKLTGGRKQAMRIEKKNQKAYDTYLHAKLFFNTNSINETVDQTPAYYRRQIIISFPNTFEGSNRDDPFFLNKIKTKEELSGIFNVLMRALRRLLKRNGLYLNEKTIAERIEKTERATNPIRAFLDEAKLPESAEDDKVTKEDMYDAYVKYCNKYRIAKKQKEDFGKALKKMGLKDGRSSTEIDGKRPTIWKGVKLSPEYEAKIVFEMNMVMTSGTSKMSE